MKLGAKRVEMVQLIHTLCHEVASEFFTKNALDPPHWIQTHVLEHFVVFRYYTDLVAKWVELVQLMKKFVPQNCIRVFRNEHTRIHPIGR